MHKHPTLQQYMALPLEVTPMHLIEVFGYCKDTAYKLWDQCKAKPTTTARKKIEQQPQGAFPGYFVGTSKKVDKYALLRWRRVPEDIIQLLISIDLGITLKQEEVA